MEGIFYNKEADYHDVVDPVKHYVEQVTTLIASKKNISREEASTIAIQLVKSKFKDRETTFFHRQDNGDRVLRKTGLYNYIRGNTKAGNIIAPSFTTYIPSSVEPSVLSEYIFDNVKNRSIAKKASQEAKSEGRKLEAVSLNDRQNNMKIKNNAVSGLFAMSSSVIYNMSAHSTLTSMTRTITSLSNANNERLVEGNRALFTPVDVFRSVVNEATYIDQLTVRKAIDKFNLYIPTVEDVVKVLKRSSDLYSKDERYYRKHIIPFLETLTDEQRAGICYTIDLYHLRDFNSEFMMNMLDDLCAKSTGYNLPMENPDIIKDLNETVVYFAHSIMFSDIKGFGKNYTKMNEAGVANNLYHTCLHIEEVLEKYELLFHAFFKTKISPINSFRLADMRRRPVVLSDTDSSAFSTDDFVKWRFGKFLVNDASIALSAGITYMASESIVHQLQRVSKSMNIETKNLRRLAMKNEYLWTTHVPAFVSKHYYADAVIQEGNVFETPDREVKGVHLKNSAVPPEIIKMGGEIIDTILDSVREGTTLNLMDVLRRAVAMEDEIISSIKRGEVKYLKAQNINEASAYSQDPSRSPYGRHLMWEEVFGPKYGSVGEPPYGVVKIPMMLDNKTDINNWVESINDVSLRQRLFMWLTENNKTSLPNIYINTDFIEGRGFPEELVDFIKIRQVVLDLTTQVRTILETLGIVLLPDILIKDLFVL